MTMHIGIDLGGTKIEIIALDDQGETLVRTRQPAPSHDYKATIDAICSLVKETEQQLGKTGTVGIGTPGALSRTTGLMKNAYATALNGKPFKDDLETALGRPIRLANDGNCFALSEAIDGAAAGAPVVFGVIIGTGCGGGVVVNGAPIEGANSIAGEWGHNALPWPEDNEREGFTYYKGGGSHIEAWLSGAALCHDHHLHSGEHLTTIEIAAAETAEREATMQRYERRMARALASVINVLDPHAIVLGGGLSNIGRLYHNVPAIWGEWIFSDQIETRLLRNKHGDSSGVRGAALLWKIG